MTDERTELVERGEDWHEIGEAMYRGMGGDTFRHDFWDDDSDPYTYSEFINDPRAYITNEEDFDMTNRRFCMMVDAVVAAIGIEPREDGEG